MEGCNEFTIAGFTFRPANVSEEAYLRTHSCGDWRWHWRQHGDLQRVPMTLDEVLFATRDLPRRQPVYSFGRAASPGGSMAERLAGFEAGAIATRS